MKDENYITILGWMINKLNLSGSELLCYALIYGFSQDKESEFKGSLAYISKTLNLSKENSRKVILRLVEKGLIHKRDEIISGVKFCRYSISNGIIETTPPPGTETTPNITILDKNKIDNKRPKQATLFPEQDKDKKTLFRTSIYGEFEKFKTKFTEPEYLNVDLFYYFNSVYNWSEKKDKTVLRTARGWIATARDFMRGDLKSNNLQMIKTPEQAEQNNIDAVEYLNL